MTKFLCQPLAKSHDREQFRCGVDPLDHYLRNQASQDVRRRVAAVFVFVPENKPQRVVGYYTLSSASIVLSELPDEMRKKLPRYPLIPAVLIGRLARDLSHSGIGKLLLFDALERSVRHSEDVASAVILVDAKNEAAQKFYARYRFQSIKPASDRMFLPMKTIEKLLSEIK